MSDLEDFDDPRERGLVRDERRRVLQLIESYRNGMDEHVYIRLWNHVRNGLDLNDELALPVEERAPGFHWEDVGLYRFPEPPENQPAPKPKPTE